jgi:hypothetical protein
LSQDKISIVNEVNYASEKENRKEEDSQKGSRQEGEEDLRLRAMWHVGDGFQEGNGGYPPDVLRRGYEIQEEVDLFCHLFSAHKNIQGVSHVKTRLTLFSCLMQVDVTGDPEGACQIWDKPWLSPSVRMKERLRVPGRGL